MKKLLSTYKQKCKEGGGDPGQELIKAMEKQLDGENIMNKVRNSSMVETRFSLNCGHSAKGPWILFIPSTVHNTSNSSER